MKAELVELSRAVEAIFSRRGVVLIRGDRIFRLNTAELTKLAEHCTRVLNEESEAIR